MDSSVGSISYSSSAHLVTAQWTLRAASIKAWYELDYHLLLTGVELQHRHRHGVQT